MKKTDKLLPCSTLHPLINLLLLLALLAVAGDKPQNFRYYVLDTSAADYKTTVAKLEAAHKRTWPLNNLSIVTNLTGTKALIKVDWGSNIEIAPTKVMTNLDVANHWKIVEMLKTTEWTTNQITNQITK